MNNRDSLRTQIIDSMKDSPEWDSWRINPGNAEKLFDESIMPILEAAMQAGELLLHRATQPQKPVDEAIIYFLDGVCASIAKIRAQEDTVSRRELLNVLYHLDESAGRAVAEARQVNQNTTKRNTGKLLDGLMSPAKG